MRRSVDSWLDRFCYKHPKLGIPNLMNYIVIGSVIVYLLNLFSEGFLSSLLYFSPQYILHGQIWRLVTFIFLPLNPNPLFLVLSLYFYWFVGSTLEREWGSVKFTVFYAMGVLLTILSGFLVGSFGLGIYVSMAYVNLSMFFAFATLYPNLQVLLFFIIPVKVKWMAWIDAAFFAIQIVRYLVGGAWILALVPIVAILNYLIFFWSDLMGMLSHTAQRAKHQRSRQTVNFKEATRHAQQQKGYIHKCAVCGKTDTDYPDLEFRYCSKCNGYYCYCMEHINNHVHIE